MYRVWIILAVLLLSGCSMTKETMTKETVTKENSAEAGNPAKADPSPEEAVKKTDKVGTDTAPSGGAVLLSEDNEYNRMAVDAYRNILKSAFPEGGYYCIVDMDEDNVYELAAAAKAPDEAGEFLSICAFINKDTKEVECAELKTSQETGFDIGLMDEAGKLIVRTGKENVHHYAFSLINGRLEKTDFLVLDSIMDSVDKTKDPDNYRKYINQDRGNFRSLLMWSITEENLKRDFSERVALTPDVFDAIDGYLRIQQKGKLYGFFYKEIEKIFSMEFSEIENSYGAPAARIYSCRVEKNEDSGNRYLNYESSFLWLNAGIGCYVMKNHTIMGTLDTFFDVRQDIYTFKELQDTLGVPFCHETSDSGYDIVFVYRGHTFYAAASDMKKGLMERGSRIKATKNAVDTGSYPLLFDPDGNITQING